MFKKSIVALLFGLCIATGISCTGRDAAVVQEAHETVSESEVQEFQTKDLLNYRFNEDGTLMITGYEGSETELEIPAEIDGASVTVVGEGAFFNRTRICRILLPDTITRIENGAFENCASLTEFVMPDSVTFLGEYVFAKAIGLEKVTISSSLEELPTQTFYGCVGLTEFTVPENIRRLGDAAFAGCTNMQRITLHNGIEGIGAGCFDEICLEEFRTGVRVLGKDALEGLSAVNLVLEEGVEIVEENGFGKELFAYVELPSTLTEIHPKALEKGCFYSIKISEENPSYCVAKNGLYTKDQSTLLRHFCRLPDGEKEIAFAEGVTSIAPHAFERFEGDGSLCPVPVTIPDTLEDLGEYAFFDAQITRVTIPESVKVIRAHTFEQSCLEEISLPSGLERIEEAAFAGMTGSISQIDIPVAVTFIAPSAFSGSQELSSFRVHKQNSCYSSVEGVLYDKDKENLLCFPGKNSLNQEGVLKVREGTKRIGAWAFARCDSLSAVYLPDSVEILEERAFLACRGLQQVSVPASVSSIGEHALGYILTSSGREELEKEDFALIGEVGSAAEAYAAENHCAFFTREINRTPERVEIVTGESVSLLPEGALAELTCFTSGDDRIVYVQDNGEILGVGEGETTVVMACGYFYLSFPVKVTGETLADAPIPRAEAVGSAYGFDPGRYTELTLDTVEAFGKRYREYNSSHSFELLDNYCIHSYSGDEYKPILVCQGDERKIPDVQEHRKWDHIEMFTPICRGLREELSSYKNKEEIVLFRGIPAAEELTGGGATVLDMKASIGTLFEPVSNLSTSVIHEVATGYATRSLRPGNAVLEIYAPSDLINGSYISSVSQFNTEYEFLINEDARFLILDAGVRDVYDPEIDRDVKERYFKLLMLEN
ncbi:MAG: leucine-rich repeat protein [Lachnospiraceae bacterium]|nr:leucine-rich repeat protein [Lachnospiraceae bacterium]